MSRLAPHQAGPPGIQPDRPGALTRQDCASLLRAAAAAQAAPQWPGHPRPWRLRLGPGRESVELHAKPSRVLRRGDPSGRIAHIASGAALFNVRLAIAVAGREPVTRLLPHDEEPLLLAITRLSGPHRPGEDERALHAAIGRQVRAGPFAGAPVPPAVLGELRDAAALEGTVLDVLDPSAWLEDGSRLAVLSIPHRTRAGWLRTGQALQRVLLLASTHGVSAAPLSPALEAPDHRMTDRLRVDGIEYPQIILRLIQVGPERIFATLPTAVPAGPPVLVPRARRP
jgi:hypothetical protein